MKALYEVTATKSRKIKGVNEYFTADNAYLVYKGYQVAKSEKEAIDLASLYISNKYDSIRASFVRED